jgi:hypothetical protein
MKSGSPPGCQSGVTYLAVLFFVAASSAMLAATAVIWSHERQRQKEQELLWIGNQFREAIGLYYQRTPGAVKRYPEKLEDLLEDRRYLTTARYLRQVYRDPMTGKVQWGLVAAPSGGIMGVRSTSAAKPVRVLEGAGSYAEWTFTYAPPASSTSTPPTLAGPSSAASRVANHAP